jgi:hypothetical protein
MGVSIAAIAVERTNLFSVIDALLNIGFAKEKSKGMKKLAFSHGENERWTWILCDVGAVLTEPVFELLHKRSSEGRIICALAQSTSGGLWFEVSANGVVIRRWMEIEGNVEFNEGEPFPEEPKGLFNSDKNSERDVWSLADLFKEFTGTCFFEEDNSSDSEVWFHPGLT